MTAKTVKEVRKITSHISEYATAMEELEDKLPRMVEKARSGSRAKAIRLKCLDCMGGNVPSLVGECAAFDCPLWPYRWGKGFDGNCFEETYMEEN